MKLTARRFAVGAGAFALALAGAVAMGAPAAADVGPDQPGAPTSGTLTINKYGGVPVDQGGDLNNPLSGVEFTVTQVGRLVGASCTAVDLTEAADWTGLEALFASAPATPADPFCLTSTTLDDETVAGSVEFTLPVGIYFVQETDPGANPIVSPVPDFYVSIPTSNGASEDGWEYNVVADPKNQLMEEPTKVIELDPSGFVVGSNVTWTISVPVPTLADGETFDSGSFTDVLNNRLEYVSSTVTPAEALSGAAAVTGQNVKWNFDTAWLDANQGSDISISLVTKVLSVGDGQIINAGGPDGNYSSEFNGTTTPGGPSAETYWGQLSILKVDDSTPRQNLEGAEFKVFLPEAGGSCAASVAEASGTAIATGTSGDDGVVLWPNTVDPTADDTDVLSLWVRNVSNGPADPTPTKDYCVYETVIPAGHTAQLIPNPVTITPGEDAINNLTVENPKIDGPVLPLTGAGGTLAMTVGGLLLVAVGAGAIIVSRRRHHAA